MREKNVLKTGIFNILFQLGFLIVMFLVVPQDAWVFVVPESQGGCRVSIGESSRGAGTELSRYMTGAILQPEITDKLLSPLFGFFSR